MAGGRGVHRDLKPSNLGLTPDGPRVVDFGIARPDGADTITVPGSVLGTPGYIPPERIRDRRSGREGDVFAFGAVLVYAATGEGPFGTCCFIARSTRSLGWTRCARPWTIRRSPSVIAAINVRNRARSAWAFVNMPDPAPA